MADTRFQIQKNKFFKNSNKLSFEFLTNYIYLYHTNEFILLPIYPESISDSSQANFQSSTPLGRSAPIYSFTSSGPRSFQVSLPLHRNLVDNINRNKSNILLNESEDKDYIDHLISRLQSMAYPRYRTAGKMIDPPMIAIRLGNEIFCKGVVTSGVTTVYKTPILNNGKYALVDIQFTVEEITPYSAEQIQDMGSYRVMDTSLIRNEWKRK